MTMIAGDLIDRSKLLANPFGFLAQISPTQLLASLSNLDSDIAMQVHQLMPSLLSTKADQITVTEASNATGYDLEPAFGFTQMIYHTDATDETRELDLVMEGDFAHPSTVPSATIVPGIGNGWLLLPTDPLGQGWTDTSKVREFWKAGDKVKYRYIPKVEQMTKLTDHLVAPDFAENYMVQSLATLIFQMSNASDDIIQNSILREQAHLRTLTMQYYKFARIHTPNHDFGNEFSTFTQDEVLLR